MPTLLPPDDRRLTWSGTISREHGANYVAPWRLPYDRLRLYPFEDLQRHAAMPAGVRVSFRSDARRLVCRFEPVDDEAQPVIDICVDGELAASLPLAGRDEVSLDDLPDGDKLLELWLPQAYPFRLVALELDGAAGGKRRKASAEPSVEQHQEDRRRWITYGSSITQCREAVSPARTWPAIVARDRNLDLTCLGFAGQCHIEPMLARLIRDQPADLISLCLGINVQGGASLNLRTFRPAVLGFASIVRERHADTPLALISPIFSPERESTPNAAGMTLQIMRQEIREAVEALRELGDENVHYVDGLELLGPDHAHLLPDDLHPDQEGYELIAARFVQSVLPRLEGGSRGS
jgi:hypothetical protein